MFIYSLENTAAPMLDEENVPVTVDTQTDQSLPDTQQLLLYFQKLEEERDNYKRQLCIEKFGIYRFSSDDEMVQYYTSFRSYRLFKKIFEFVQPCASSMCSMYYVPSDSISLAGRPRNMSLIDEMFMFFVRLRLGLPEQDLAVRLNCHISTISRKLLTWTNFLYIILGSIPIWPSRVTVDRHMPPEFRLTYPSTRVILDCTEIKIQYPSALVLNSMVFSHYKGSPTLKGLIGIAPNGAVTFVSNLFTGVMSDVEITKLSDIINLLESGDSVMADKGFTIASMLSEKGVGLNIPPFLHSAGQFTSEEIQDTQAIASLRIHVERLIRRVKENHLFDSSISISELGSINQLWTVACLTSGFQGPLIKKK